MVAIIKCIITQLRAMHWKWVCQSHGRYLTAIWRPWKVLPQTKRDNYEAVPSRAVVSGGVHTEEKAMWCSRVWWPIPQLGPASNPPCAP